MNEEQKRQLKAIFEAMGIKESQVQVGQIIGTQVNFFGTQPVAAVQGGVQEAKYEEVHDSDPTQSAPAVPAVLNTPAARLAWARAIEQGWVDAQWQPLLSQPRAAVLASVMGEVLNLTPQWPPFEQLWSIPDLGTKCYKARECAYFSDLYKDMKTALMKLED